jgi:hypothetical protein
MSYEEKFDYLKKRFKGAQFVVSCFDTIDEVETKPLTTRDTIIYMDCYTISTLPKGKKKWVEVDEEEDEVSQVDTIHDELAAMSVAASDAPESPAKKKGKAGKGKGKGKARK